MHHAYSWSFHCLQNMTHSLSGSRPSILISHSFSEVRGLLVFGSLTSRSRGPHLLTRCVAHIFRRSSVHVDKRKFPLSLNCVCCRFEPKPLVICSLVHRSWSHLQLRGCHICCWSHDSCQCPCYSQASGEDEEVFFSTLIWGFFVVLSCSIPLICLRKLAKTMILVAPAKVHACKERTGPRFASRSYLASMVQLKSTLQIGLTWEVEQVSHYQSCYRDRLWSLFRAWQCWILPCPRYALKLMAAAFEISKPFHSLLNVVLDNLLNLLQVDADLISMDFLP